MKSMRSLPDLAADAQGSHPEFNGDGVKDRLKVLLIEDNPGDRRLIKELLMESQLVLFELEWVKRLSSGLTRLAKGGIDSVLLDLALPDSQGLETLLHVHRHAPEMAIVVLTGLDNELLGVEAMQAGAQDYLVKGQINGQLLARAIRYAIERKHSESRLKYLATHDELTGLPNRQVFQDRLDQALAQVPRKNHNGDKRGLTAMMLLDLDHFKDINDTFGHALGDRLLCVVADRLRQCVRKSDTVSRLGGDEFILLSEEITQPNDSFILAERILLALSEPFVLAGHTLGITASIGISLFPCDASDAEMLFEHADQAMYRAKRTRNRFCLYNSSAEDI